MNRAGRAAENIREHVPISRLLADYGYMVDPRGDDREQQFSCDLHGDGQDSKPSARLYPGSGQFYCFACGISRDHVALVREKEGVSFWEAVKILERRYDVPALPWEPDEQERPPTPEEEVATLLQSSETAEDALRRTERLLRTTTRERELPVKTCMGLWGVYDRVVAAHQEGVEEAQIVQMAHSILEKTKKSLRGEA